MTLTFQPCFIRLVENEIIHRTVKVRIRDRSTIGMRFIVVIFDEIEVHRFNSLDIILGVYLPCMFVSNDKHYDILLTFN